MYHDYNPYETREEYIERKTRADREWERQMRHERAARRKRVKSARVRQHMRARVR
jgi:hypothetical protein